jgi:hypothetical protein
MALQIGRKGQVYVKQEADYNVEEALAVTNALRHIDVGLAFDPFNRVTSSEKKSSPGAVTRFDRRKTAGLSTLVGLLHPSGALNTLAECDPILKAAFGTVTNVTLSTTIAASPSPTADGATVASAGALAVGDMVLITVTGEDGPFVRRIDSVATNALTWSPALPAAPTTGDALKGGVTYTLSTDLAISLTLAHYLSTTKRELTGLGINDLSLAFEANEEPRFTASGPAATQLTGTAQAQPGGFTTVGGNPPSGLIGQLLVNDTVYLFKKFEARLANGLKLRTDEYGVATASEILRAERREVGCSLEALAETESVIYDLAEAGTTSSVLKQTGYTEGNIVGVYMPRVEWKVGEQDDPDTEVSWTFAGMALESSDGQNDELTLGLL